LKAEKALIDRGSAGITAVMLAIVIYGSLYRIRFPIHLDPLTAFRELLGTWNTFSRPGDVLANVVFYLPFGFFLARALPRLRPWTAIATGAAAGLILSFTMEMLQYHIRGRHSAMSDVYADTVGAFLGACAGSLSLRLPRSGMGMQWNHPALLLLACWLGNRLYPYVPVIDLHKYLDAVRPLLVDPELNALGVYTHAVYWLTIALLLEAMAGTRSRLILPACFLFLIVARVLVARVVLSPDEILGGVAGVLVWTLWMWRSPARLALAAALLGAGLVIQALEPFRFSGAARPFGWIPFRSLIRGSPDVAVLSFFEKTFAYGGFVWLLHRTGQSWMQATLRGAALVAVLRAIQVYIPGRSAEITDVLLLLIVATIMQAMRRSAEPA
jgi:VanZ family protein